MTDIAELLKKHTDGVEAKLAEIKSQTEQYTPWLTEIERKLNRGVTSADGGLFGTKAGTIGHQITSSEDMTALRESGSNGATRRFEVKAITNAADSGGDLHAPNRDAAVLLPRRRLTIRNLLRVVPVTSQDVEYPEQTQRADQAAPVAEGALKPESSMAFTLKTVATKTLAHWVTASRQVLQDNSQLEALINDDLRHGLLLEEEGQILYGDGTGQNLPGIIPTATTFADPLSLVAPNQIDAIGSALLQADLTDVTADGIVLNPIDWQRMRMLKDAQGHYILGAPGADVPPVLFGRRVVATQAMNAGTFLVGPFQSGATLYDRMKATILISTEHADYFTRNLVAILGEERVGLGVRRPSSFITGTLPA
ncbi:phage major capsid protein [Croceicoccus marinus]|uniref:Phage major capsid protein n=1 Tax=Croceicoccus marinus TaxID=450378 RepID=A0A7G6VRU1_9SPHN|nr:phage major capsid protein [Croceicoccus marinus]QNE04456.1 phage major capsid protein [Croceicoccus marinus]